MSANFSSDYSRGPQPGSVPAQQIPPTRCPAHASPLYGPAFHSDPYGYYESMRHAGPVVPIRMTDDGTFWGWLALGYNEVLQVLRNADGAFSHDSRYWNFPRHGQVLRHPMLTQMEYRQNMLYADGDAHRRLRQPASEALERLQSGSVVSYVSQICDELIDSFSPRGEADLIAQYTGQLPLLVMMGIMGIEDRHAGPIAQAIAGLFEEGADAGRATAMLDDLMAHVVAGKRANPGADLVSWMIASGPQLTVREQTDQARLLLVAGLGAGTAWMSLILHELLTEPQALAQIRGGMYTMSDIANGIMWKASPIQSAFGRFATKDTLLGGARIACGDLVIPSFHAANVDPRVKPDPEAAMQNRGHLSWGAGIHACPAQKLGGLIVITAAEHLMRRLPQIRLAVAPTELRWAPTVVVRTLTALPVVFPPAAPLKAAPTAATATPQRPRQEPYTPSPQPPSVPESRSPSEPPTRWRSLVGLLRGR